mmetsp:Transcript_20880/g.38316  ORF Transcript_20880/g.38316 Transcript_20880/m.38316 type:complete len:92 (+) Transcript_20880:119-394(+)
MRILHRNLEQLENYAQCPPTSFLLAEKFKIFTNIIWKALKAITAHGRRQEMRVMGGIFPAFDHGALYQVTPIPWHMTCAVPKQSAVQVTGP